MLRFTTAGESHGRALVAIVEGLPANLPIDHSLIDRELEQRDGILRPVRRLEIELPRAERDEKWAQITAAAPGFAEYQQKTTRVIPVLALTRV